jgi:hypothetical protein
MKTLKQPLENIQELKFQISEAINSVRMLDMKPESKKVYFAEALKYLVDFTGKIDISADQIDFMVKTLTDQITIDYPYLHKEEFKLAIKRGAAGNYGEIYTISALTIYTFLKAYLGEKKTLFKQMEETNRFKAYESKTAVSLDEYYKNNPNGCQYIRKYMKK